jgi:anti-sigma factor RsiW
MNAESQHLDFLISQYVDGTLEVAGKKSVEQQLLTDPEARRLYAEHREVQDLLDDYGSRIPLINWGEFDATLDARLEAEAREKQRASIFRRRLKPVAVAAALAIAATLGYTWHAFSHERAGPIAPGPGVVQTTGTASANVAVLDTPAATRASYAGMRVVEPGMQGTGSVDGLAFGAPADQVALQALQTNVEYGFAGLFGKVNPQTAPSPSVVGSSGSDRPADEPDPLR